MDDIFGHSQTSNIESLLGCHSILICLQESTLMAAIFGFIQVHVRKPILPNTSTFGKDRRLVGQPIHLYQLTSGERTSTIPNMFSYFRRSLEGPKTVPRSFLVMSRSNQNSTINHESNQIATSHNLWIII